MLRLSKGMLEYLQVFTESNQLVNTICDEPDKGGG